jgi:hypothetical protein
MHIVHKFKNNFNNFAIFCQTSTPLTSQLIKIQLPQPKYFCNMIGGMLIKSITTYMATKEGK